MQTKRTVRQQRGKKKKWKQERGDSDWRASLHPSRRRRSGRQRSEVLWEDVEASAFKVLSFQRWLLGGGRGEGAARKVSEFGLNVRTHDKNGEKADGTFVRKKFHTKRTFEVEITVVESRHWFLGWKLTGLYYMSWSISSSQLALVLANYGAGALFSLLSFWVWPADLEEIYLYI